MSRRRILVGNGSQKQHGARDKIDRERYSSRLWRQSLGRGRSTSGESDACFIRCAARASAARPCPAAVESRLVICRRVRVRRGDPTWRSLGENADGESRAARVGGAGVVLPTSAAMADRRTSTPPPGAASTSKADRPATGAADERRRVRSRRGENSRGSSTFSFDRFLALRSREARGRRRNGA